MVLPAKCSLCTEEAATSYLEGHKKRGEYHVFDPSCIRVRLNIHPYCPTCEDHLTIAELKQYPNPHYSYIPKSISSWKFSITSFTWGCVQAAKKVTMVALIVGTGYYACGQAQDLAPEAADGFIVGASSTITTSAIVAIPMLLNKINGKLMKEISFKHIILPAGVLSSLLISSTADVEDAMDVAKVTGSAIAAATTATLLGDGPLFQEGGDVETLGGDTETKFFIPQAVMVSTLGIGVVTSSKWAWVITTDWNFASRILTVLASATLSLPAVYSIDMLSLLLSYNERRTIQ